MTYKDQLGREIVLKATPKRIVSLVPSQTELLVHLGVENSIVGLTKFCVHPSNLRNDKVVVGGTKNIHIDKIASLQPDLIICNKEENTKDIVEACMLIAPVWISDIKTLADNNDMILSLGEILNNAINAAQIVKEIEKEASDFSIFISQKSPKKVAYCIWKNPYMVVGNDTFIDSLLELNKFRNIFSGAIGRYPEVSIDELKNAEIVLLSSEPYPFKDANVSELKNELLCEVRLVDGEYFSWYGSRMKHAFAYFRTLHT
jgi:ABC-type Fe3+-hydroxamate transport system substrate-binding protein